MAILTEPASTRQSAIMAVVVCFMISFLEGFDLQAAGIAAPKLASELGMSAKLLGLFFAIATIGIIVGAYIGGRLSDRLGRKTVLLTSVAIFGVASILCGLTYRADVLLAARFVIGLGLGAALPNLIAIAAASSAPERRNQTVTLIHAGLPFGVAGASIFAWLLPADAWRVVFVTGGIAPLAILPLTYLFVSEPGRTSDTAPKVSAITALFGEGRAMLTLTLWLAFVFALLVAAVMVYWLPTLMISSGLTPHQAFAVQIGYGLAGAVGSLTTGALMDRFARKSVALGIFAAAAAAFLIMGLASSSFAIAIVMGALLGILTSAAQASLYALAPAAYPEAFRGTGVGAAVAVGRAGTILGPLLAGAMVAAGTSSAAVLAGMAPVAILGGVFAVYVSIRLERQPANA